MSSVPEPARVGDGLGFDALVGESAALHEAIRLAQRVAATRTTVLLIGATGTGKELIARGIHYGGPTQGEPFVAVNCAAIPAGLLESELFGYERGAFTGAQAQKRGLMELAGEGTLFLDEIGELPRELQPKLLRVLEDRRVRRIGGLDELPIHCRVIAATNLRLEDAVARGEFREDLFYRLAVFRIRIPALRERDDDIELLARHFLEGLARVQDTRPKRLSADAVATLRLHGWPGNVRELKNVIERAAILAEGEEVRADHLLIQRRTTVPAGTDAAGGEIVVPREGKTLSEIEREAILLTLRLTGGNRSAAARMLGISRPRLARKLKEWGDE